MEVVRRAWASSWRPPRSETVLMVDALVLRPLLFLALWHLADWFPHRTEVVRLQAAAVLGVNLAAWSLCRQRRVVEVILPLVNVLWWTWLLWESGSGQSPFLLGSFLEIGVCALRLSEPGCVVVSLMGGAGLALVARRDPTAAGAMVAATGSVCVFFTGLVLALVVRSLRAAVEESQQRAAYVAHRLKNSLNGAAGFAELLATELSEEDPRRRHTQRIRTILADAHAPLAHLIAPPTDGNDHPRAELHQAAANAIAECSGLLERSGTRCILDVPHGLEAQMSLDELKVILVDLIQNAVESMKPRGGEVRLEAYPSPLRLVVTDTGPGIPADIRSRVFETRFTRKPDGHGLGLSGARRTLRESGGSIRALEASGGGAAIEIHLRSAPGGAANRQEG